MARVRVRFEFTGAARFVASGVFCWIFAGGIFAFLGAVVGTTELAARFHIALPIVADCAIVLGAYLVLLGGYLFATGRPDTPDHYLYDLTVLDAVGSTTLTVTLAVTLTLTLTSLPLTSLPVPPPRRCGTRASRRPCRGWGPAGR